jgi:hypothetical protein
VNFTIAFYNFKNHNNNEWFGTFFKATYYDWNYDLKNKIYLFSMIQNIV